MPHTYVSLIGNSAHSDGWMTLLAVAYVTHTRRLVSLLTDHTLNDVNHIAAKILRHMYLSADEAVPTQKTHRPTVGQQLTSGDVTGNTNRFQKHNRTVQTEAWCL